MTETLTKMQGERTKRLAESYLKTYKTQFQGFEKSPIARMKSINEYDIVALGKQLEAFEWHVALEEANGSVANLGPLPRIGLDVITASYGISPLALICGIQPIDDVIGLVWFKDTLAKNTRGNVTTNQKLITALASPDVFPTDFSSDTVFSNRIYTNANGAQTLSNVAIASGDVASPLDMQRCVVRANAIFNAGADAAVFPDMIVNPTNGEFSSAVKVNGTVYSVYGVINGDTGVMTSLAFSADPSGQTDVYVDYAVLMEEATDIPRTLLQMQAKTVQARFYALKSTFGFAQNYMAQRRWGMGLEDEMTKDLSSLIQAEVFNIALKKIIDTIPGSNATVTWGRNPQSGVSYYEHIMTLPAAISDANALLVDNLGRGAVNTLVAGNKASQVLSQHPDFKQMFDDDTLGPCIFGEFQGKPVVRVPSNSQLNTNTIIGLWKGKTPFEAPVAYSPYMPLTMSAAMGTGTNPLQMQKFAAMWGATTSMIPNGSVKIVVDQTGFDFGAA